MSVSDTIRQIKVKADRMWAFAALVKTFESAEEQKTFVLAMRDQAMISDQAADLLIEELGLQAA